jgi:hypothetical protein
LQTILKRSKLEEHLFLELNKTPLRDTVFDDIQTLRRDVSGVLKAICQCCSSGVIYSFFQQSLKLSVDLL